MPEIERAHDEPADPATAMRIGAVAALIAAIVGWALGGVLIAEAIQPTGTAREVYDAGLALVVVGFVAVAVSAALHGLRANLRGNRATRDEILAEMRAAEARAIKRHEDLEQKIKDVRDDMTTIGQQFAAAEEHVNGRLDRVADGVRTQAGLVSGALSGQVRTIRRQPVADPTPPRGTRVKK